MDRDDQDARLAEMAPDVDLTRPNSARMYDYYLGGFANFAVDRDAAEAGLAAMPYARDYALANRAFLGRAVRHLLDAGVRQFLDLGSGIPTAGNVHEIAQALEPEATVAYVDHEAVAVAHARSLLAGNPRVSITQADIRRPDEVLTAPGVAELIDFRKPVAILAVAILPFVPDQAEAVALVRAYREACVPGSYFAVSHISQLMASDAQVAAAEDVMARTPTPVRWRDRTRIAELLDGYALVPPGLVPSPEWNPEFPPSDEEIGRANAYVAVGRC
ncbi:S-adenosyl methyltransferase [Tamaricihabitans halophyticus]|uniref:S-adenosyl methyltransferase n=1 Tax=Tamaricihabitans halophyticus TaxID=1262583 RepID=A0A4V6NR79_9PSEU|nr:SAM-dependent methyltransferase [Tamaricihabitans halophyticus]TCP48466.1 S-adenosyl methyltransferase [Tamaricihabitans halophyticus]